MNRKILALLLPLLLVFASKPRYGGSLSIKLDEPSSFSLNNSSYSNLILYSLIYENFFFLQESGGIVSHIFKEYAYDGKTRTLTLVLKDNLSFSNGKPITPDHIQTSLNIFLHSDLLSASRLAKILKNIRQDNGRMLIELLADTPDILSLLCEPELVVLTDSEQAFSGPFFPSEWLKSRYITLSANPFYPGGRPYLDTVKVVFEAGANADLFLGPPGQAPFQNDYGESNSGIYQNIYLCFPQAGIGQNTRVALYTLLQQFNQTGGSPFSPLHALTSDAESPISVEIKPLAPQKVIAVLKNFDAKLHVLSSLSGLESDLRRFLGQSRLKLEPVFIDDAQLKSSLNSAAVKIILIDKVFQKKTSAEEKISLILKELSFSRFNEKYLRLLSELAELEGSHDSQLLAEQVAKISETIIQDGFILPLFQKNFSLYVKKTLDGLEIDYFGRPLLQRANLKRD